MCACGLQVRFNKEQLDVIVGGLQPGLTMCVGPPGTGKTDTAVQARTPAPSNHAVLSMLMLVWFPQLLF